ncbi:hypothetical protein SAMN02745823_00626 [Sporobacter termitidis DSM 10068]|uniref:Uncharacterized protein n=1 Tax=Sporobacter termitidis DSM 10068 TaxID=1123282 RepID=A0A1M5UQ25_9FIRM|nr:hypothetical protein [Sporobacter termitidis]SHH65125.1 hypothetical protein SAMN02745823_00626 [Sporobacter termitidis DSM 10068]
MSEHEHEHHTHVHGKDCACGHHEHHDHDHHDHDHHGHAHDENGNCILEDVPGAVYVEYHLHDEARVISGRLTLTAEYGPVREALASQLELMAKTVQERGGIVGHIKASCEVRLVEMLSVTDTESAVKRAPGQEIKIILAAIVFLIDPEEAEELAHAALAAVRDAAGK